MGCVASKTTIQSTVGQVKYQTSYRFNDDLIEQLQKSKLKIKDGHKNLEDIALDFQEVRFSDIHPQFCQTTKDIQLYYSKVTEVIKQLSFCENLKYLNLKPPYIKWEKQENYHKKMEKSVGAEKLAIYLQFQVEFMISFYNELANTLKVLNLEKFSFLVDTEKLFKTCSQQEKLSHEYIRGIQNCLQNLNTSKIKQFTLFLPVLNKTIIQTLSEKFSKQKHIKSVKISKYGTENLLQHEIGIKMDESQKLSNSRSFDNGHPNLKSPDAIKDGREKTTFDYNENNENFQLYLPKELINDKNLVYICSFLTVMSPQLQSLQFCLSNGNLLSLKKDFLEQISNSLHKDSSIENLAIMIQSCEQFYPQLVYEFCERVLLLPKINSFSIDIRNNDDVQEEFAIKLKNLLSPKIASLEILI